MTRPARLLAVLLVLAAACSGEGEPRGAEGGGLGTFGSARTAFAALQAGALAAVVDDEAGSWAQVEDRPGLRPVQSIDTGERVGFAVRADEAGLATVLAQEVRGLVATGTYARIFAKYFPGVPCPRPSWGDEEDVSPGGEGVSPRWQPLPAGRGTHIVSSCAEGRAGRADSRKGGLWADRSGS